MSLHPPIREAKLCYVTDRKSLPGHPDEQARLLLEKIESAARAGVDWIQIREKDLCGRELAGLVAEAVRRVPVSCRILVNDRLDVAVACGAGGVHLGEHSLPLEEARRFWWKANLSGQFLIGVSVHSLQSAQMAQHFSADYTIFGPVYGTPSKASFGPPQGVQRLAELCEGVSVPVIAIGGVTVQNKKECMEAGARGIAAIRMFQDATDMAKLLQKLRQE